MLFAVESMVKGLFLTELLHYILPETQNE